MMHDPFFNSHHGNGEAWFGGAEELSRRKPEPFADPYGKPGAESSRWQPRADVLEREDGYVIIMEVPGFARETLRVAVQGEVLTVSGQRIEEVHEELEVHQRESNPGSFERAFQLPEDVDTERVHAELEDGVLSIHLPRKEDRRPRRIEVR